MRKIKPDAIVRAYNSGQRDFSSCDMKGLNLSNITLIGASLRQSDLRGVKLQNALLRNADLSQTKIGVSSNARVWRFLFQLFALIVIIAICAMAFLMLIGSGSTPPSIPTVFISVAFGLIYYLFKSIGKAGYGSLNAADLTDANLRGATILNADFRNAILMRTNLFGIIYNEDDLLESNNRFSSPAVLKLAATGNGQQKIYHGDNLSGLYLRAANLTGADLSRTYLQDTDLSSANLSAANLSGANLCGTFLSNAILDQADLSGAMIDYLTVSRSNWNIEQLFSLRERGCAITGLSNFPEEIKALLCGSLRHSPRTQEPNLLQEVLQKNSPVKSMASGTPTRATLRKLITATLKTDSDFSAFCCDYFPEVSSRFSNGMDRVSKLTYLLELADQNRILFHLIDSKLVSKEICKEIIEYI